MVVAIKILFVIACACYGGFIARLHGGGFFSLPKVINNFLWSIPFAALSGYAFYKYGYEIPYIIAATLLSLALCIFGKATGHGQWFLYSMEKCIEPERLDFLVKLFWGADPRTRKESCSLDLSRNMRAYGLDRLYWRNVTGLTLVGFTAVSGTTLALLYLNPISGLVLAIGGILKGPSYMFGDWAIGYSEEDTSGEFDEATEVGEGLSGVFAYIGLAVAALLL